MKVIVDTNRIIASLIKEGATREILFDKYFDFLTPDYTISEIEEHKEELKIKTKLADKEFDILLALLFEHIEIVPESEYKNYVKECDGLISDKDDILFLASCISSNAEGIWAHDPHFKEQNKVKVFTNIDMLMLSGKSHTLT